MGSGIPSDAIIIPNILNEWLPATAEYLGFNGVPQNGTGILPVLNFIKDFHPDVLTKQQISYLGAQMPGVIGGFPVNNTAELTINGFLLGMSIIIFVVSLGIFLVDYRNGHFFYPMLLISAYGLLQLIGFVCRYRWTYDLTNMATGLTSVILIQFSQYLLTLCNLIFAQRLCDWKRPALRTYRVLFALFYVIGFVSFICSMIGQLMQFTNILTPTQQNSFRNLLAAGSFLELVFTVVPFPFVYITAYGLMELEKTNHSLPVYQADWIASAGLFYYPIPTHRTVNASKYPVVIRVIPTIEAPGNGRSKCISRPMLPGAPKVLWAHYIVLLSSSTFASAPVMRYLAALLSEGPRLAQYLTDLSPVKYNYNFYFQSPEAMWEFFGFIPQAVLVVWMLLRVDLRFYLAPIYWRNERSVVPSKIQTVYEMLT